ncbi:unnamed protein product [Protopolystoma xenopodis]|uniref:Uncharacterized protein n=1 Tax=Protopolystoma xenopodis TaxID=117903 RepID=A0A3S5BQ56_9PLAT|nr:unnamed protein product [Protopolystoma xenopodis]
MNPGRLQLAGLEFRGHAMFSHYQLPLISDALEYAWLMELTMGRLSGQVTTPELVTLINFLSSFLSTATDLENELIPSRSYELCQHSWPQEAG